MKKELSYKNWNEYQCDNDCGGCIYEEVCEGYGIKKVSEDNKKVKR